MLTVWYQSPPSFLRLLYWNWLAASSVSCDSSAVFGYLDDRTQPTISSAATYTAGLCSDFVWTNTPPIQSAVIPPTVRQSLLVRSWRVLHRRVLSLRWAPRPGWLLPHGSERMQRKSQSWPESVVSFGDTAFGSSLLKHSVCGERIVPHSTGKSLSRLRPLTILKESFERFGICRFMVVS